MVLNLTDGITWEKVFDAGFRPKHLSDGFYMCRQYDVDLSIKLSSGVLLPLGRGDVDFSVKENDLIIGFSFFGRENRSLEEAKEKSVAFAKMFGENIIQQAEFKTFQTKHEVDYSGRKIDPPEIEEHIDLNTTTNAAKIGDFSIIYSFSDSYMGDSPLLERLSVSLKSQEAKRAKRLTEKIRPPEGYEHVSLEPDQDDAASESESAVPNSEREDEQAKVISPNQNPEPTESKAAVKKANYLLWVIVGVLLVGILAILIRAFLRGRAP